MFGRGFGAVIAGAASITVAFCAEPLLWAWTGDNTLAHQAAPILILYAIGNGILAKAENTNVVFCQLVPWHFEHHKQMNLKRTFRRASCLVIRLAGNMGVSGTTPLLARFRRPVEPPMAEKRWLEGLYLDVPEEWDDPYRFFRW